jgi:hypothetical protein
MEGFSLKELLFSYNESYVPEVDVEGIIGVKKKKYGFSKRKWKEIIFANFISKIKKVLNEEFCCGVGAAMCCSLNYHQHFLHQMTIIFNKIFRTNCLRRNPPTHWIFQEGCIEE